MSQYFTLRGGISNICAHFATNEPLFLSIIGLFPFGTKGDNNVRGHIGTEMNNKAEAVLLIDKSASDPNISEVKPLYTREKESKPFAFTVNAEGLLELASRIQP
jgi:hypothetical protein